MSGARIGSAAVAAAFIVTVYALWPHSGPPARSDPATRRMQMEMIQNERQNANTAALLGSSAVPALYDTGEPPPWAAVAPQASAQTR